MNDFDSFAKLVQAIEPWRNSLVFIGGWAHRLHRLHPSAVQPPYEAVFTRDSDIAFAHKAPDPGDIKAALAAQGFQEQLSGEFKPPVAQYILGKEDQGFYAEFLTPLSGTGRYRDQRPDATLSWGGISAQKIRNLDILLVDPWTIELQPSQVLPLPAAVAVQVANPLCFMVQKFLIQSDRTPAKRAQDLLYVFDTIELFGSLMDEFNKSWHDRIAPYLGPLAKSVVEVSQKSFVDMKEIVPAAARIRVDRQLDPDRIQRTCQLAFEEIFLAPRQAPGHLHDDK